ncbi:MAG: hypothetical protein HY318_09385, partial [Armatimonadetes bacterium]|nr:hypothetical protein [Armatimonadota bacterium]
EVVLFFDANGKSQSPHGSSAIVAGRHEGGANACYADGHVKRAAKLPESAFEPKQ